MNIGTYNNLKVLRKVDFGFYLGDGENDVLLPKRFAPADLEIDDDINVFVYNDNENRPIATTQTPYAILGDIAYLTVKTINPAGAFVDIGIMKDLFVPKSGMVSHMVVGERYLIKVLLDERTGRLTGTERVMEHITNRELTVGEGDEVTFMVVRETDLGYVVIVNKLHSGLLFHSDVFEELSTGDVRSGYVHKIREGNRLDVKIGARGYERIMTAENIILQELKANGGYLPLNDKSTPEEIFHALKMSKKAFKMAIGSLYKQRSITLERAGIKLKEAEGD